MSSPLRRADRAMPEPRAQAMLERSFCGRLTTVGADGYPYCTPLLYVWMDGEIYLHTGSGRGRLRANVEREPRICFELDEPDQVFDYGRFEMRFRSGLPKPDRVRQNSHRRGGGGQAALLRGADDEIRQAGHAQAKRLFPTPRRHHGLRRHGRAHDGQGNGAAATLRAVACGRQDQDAERAAVRACLMPNPAVASCDASVER